MIPFIIASVVYLITVIQFYRTGIFSLFELASVVLFLIPVFSYARSNKVYRTLCMMFLEFATLFRLIPMCILYKNNTVAYGTEEFGLIVAKFSGVVFNTVMLIYILTLTVTFILLTKAEYKTATDKKELTVDASHRIRHMSNMLSMSVLAYIITACFGVAVYTLQSYMSNVILFMVCATAMYIAYWLYISSSNKEFKKTLIQDSKDEDLNSKMEEI